jgi:hypothetical protein
MAEGRLASGFPMSVWDIGIQLWKDGAKTLKEKGPTVFKKNRKAFLLLKTSIFPYEFMENPAFADQKPKSLSDTHETRPALVGLAVGGDTALQTPRSATKVGIGRGRPLKVTTRKNIIWMQSSQLINGREPESTRSCYPHCIIPFSSPGSSATA